MIKVSDYIKTIQDTHMFGALALIGKSNPALLNKQQQKALQSEENALYNQKLEVIFDAFASLPVCIFIKKAPCRLDTFTPCVVNGINNMAIFLRKEKNEKYFFELRIPPDRISGAAPTYCNAPLELDEAEKLLALWTLMSKPYHILDWPLECQANEKSPNPETHDNVHE